MQFHARGTKLPFSSLHQHFLTLLPFSYGLNLMFVTNIFLDLDWVLDGKQSFSFLREATFSCTMDIYHDPPFSSWNCKYFVTYVPSMFWQSYSSNDCQEAITGKHLSESFLCAGPQEDTLKCLHFSIPFISVSNIKRLHRFLSNKTNKSRSLSKQLRKESERLSSLP